jgi:hypothetical protein
MSVKIQIFVDFQGNFHPFQEAATPQTTIMLTPFHLGERIRIDRQDMEYSLLYGRFFDCFDMLQFIKSDISYGAASSQCGDDYELFDKLYSPLVSNG